MAAVKGDEVTLPDRYGPCAGLPGEVVSVEDDWAMVDCGSWGIFGMPADSIEPTSHDHGGEPDGPASA